MRPDIEIPWAECTHTGILENKDEWEDASSILPFSQPIETFQQRCSQLCSTYLQTKAVSDPASLQSLTDSLSQTSLCNSSQNHTHKEQIRTKWILKNSRGKLTTQLKYVIHFLIFSRGVCFTFRLNP